MKFQVHIKTEMLKSRDISCYVVFILLINVKMTTIVGFLTFMSRINFLFCSSVRLCIEKFYNL